MFRWVTAAAAVLCLVYYIVIVVYSGFTTSFAWFWPAAAVFLALLSAGAWYARKYPKRIPLWVSVPAVTVPAAGLAVFAVTGILVFLGASASVKPSLDYLIVLGAKVDERGISRSLKHRLDTAIAYAQENPGTVLILSGGQGPDEPVSESQAMYDYLLYNGVPAQQMRQENVSSSTVENIAYSRVLIGQLEEERLEARNQRGGVVPPGPFQQVENKPLQVGILTSDFHVFRALQIAKKWNIPNVHGICAPSDPVLFVHLCVRECAAILKDQLMGNM